MSISTMVSACPGSLMAARSTVLKPAVRGVTDWKKDASTRSPAGRSENSRKKKYAAGSRISRAVVARMTLLCIR